MTPELESVASLRARLWDAGFRPVPVATNDKRPLARAWSELARQDPPQGAVAAPSPAEANTGLLCDGLRGIDVDIDDPDRAADVRALIFDMLGDAPQRTRPNSPRFMALFRAADGAPRKLILSGRFGKIEVLGYGQQALSFGTHPSGADLAWYPEPPGEITFDQLPVVTEEQVEQFLKAAAGIVGAEEVPAVNGADRTPNPKQLADDQLKLVAALSEVDNGPKDWERWNRIGMAFYAGMGGSGLGWQAWNAWCGRHPAYDFAEVKERWENYRNSPPQDLGAGTIVWLAKQAKPIIQPVRDIDLSVLSLSNWLSRDLPEPDFLLGEVLSTTTKAMLVGPSGLGKTMLALGMAMSIAGGRNFLHWLVPGPRRVLFIDGEMSRRLMKKRAIDEYMRANGDPAWPLKILSCEDFPDMAPLNSKDGQAFIDYVIERLGFDLIVFDNIQALTQGDQREESTWEPVLPWNRELTRRSIGQMWVHHTGLDQTHSYGSSSREWGLDLVALMEDIDPEHPDLTFRLKFPKARERTPDNRHDFAPAVISLIGNEWTTQTGGDVALAATIKKRRHLDEYAFDCLKNALAEAGEMPQHPKVPPMTVCVPFDLWRRYFNQNYAGTGEAESVDKMFYRFAAKLQAQQRIRVEKPWVWKV